MSAITTEQRPALFDLINEAVDNGLSLQVNVHDVPVELAIDWLQRGLLSRIEQGAMNGGNPPTGRLDAEGAHPAMSPIVNAFLKRA